jgi:hypothetical protein
MSELNYIKLKNCSCCSARFDRCPRRDIRRVSENDVVTFNTVKLIILTNKRKLLDTNIINVGDYVCGSCRSYAKKYKTDNAHSMDTIASQHSDNNILDEDDHDNGQEQAKQVTIYPDIATIASTFD